MKLPFLDRDEETARLARLLESPEGSLAVLYGRRRCGKSRLLREVLPPERSIYYVGDEREGPLQQVSLAAEIARLLPGFDRVTYPDWDSLCARFWNEAGPGTALVLDEFPALAAVAGELPSVLQKYVDRFSERRIHLLLAGSSQRLMQGLALDRTAPLFGRAREILKISPLRAGWIQRALRLRDPSQAVEAYAVWGGVPRYWELAGDHPDLATAVRSLILSPLGVLYEEPSRLLLDDLRDTAQAASILSVIGQGCHRASEIAARLGKPATSLSRPLERLIEMDLVARETPFGTSVRSSKRTLYRIADPFLRYWFRFVQPDRSRLEARQAAAVERDVAARFPHHAGEVWEELARASVPALDLFGKTWGPAGRWWGPGLDRQPLEIDLVAESTERDALLIGEVKWTASADPARTLQELERKAAQLPFVEGREIVLALWLKAPVRGAMSRQVMTPQQVLTALL
ncbi:MAG TPA: ATP-binding protein [Thermoanaerobaculia bacterium]|nr:ATP-binding protein [Thermoanaerobaculia bacterium]